MLSKISGLVSKHHKLIVLGLLAIVILQNKELIKSKIPFLNRPSAA